MNYYNEHDLKAAVWLRELIAQGLIPAGDVDTRSITEVKPNDLTKYTQCHFFAGVGGWSYALQLAGWPATRPVWTGSCPCQPFSAAGSQDGTADERHLWPVFFTLIQACTPPVVFGEQVASALVVGKVGGGHKEADGPVWLDGVSADMESAGYATGSIVLGAHSVGAPHIRQRLYWMAHAAHLGHERGHDTTGQAGRNGAPLSGTAGGLAYTPSGGQRIDGSPPRESGHADQCGEVVRLGDAFQSRLEGQPRNGDHGHEPGRDGAEPHGPATASGVHGNTSESPGFTSHWSNFDLLPCTDGKARRVESGTFPLAHGIPARVVRLRGYGNAIVPQVAAEFIAAYLETVSE